MLSGGIDVDGWEKAAPTISFDDERLSGVGGCNNYGAAYEADGSSISIGAVMSTKMACPAPADQVERDFFSSFEAVDEWSVEDGRLVLSGSGGELTFEPA